MNGKDYQNTLLLYESSETTYVSFPLEGEYTALTATIGMPDAFARSVKDSIVLDIYGDDILLFTHEAEIGIVPTDLTLDVSGVKELRFEIKPQAVTYSTGVGVADIRLK